MSGRWSARFVKTGFAATLAILSFASGAQADVVDALRSCGLTAGETGVVSKVVDGDTLVLKTDPRKTLSQVAERQVRLVGIQAPKLPLGRKDFEPWPMGEAAKAVLRKMVLHKEVQLFYGKTREDRHGRILAHVVVRSKSGSRQWAEKALLERGFARVYSFADNRLCVEAMLGFERSARASRTGIWSQNFYAIRPQHQAGRYLGSFQLVEGRVLDVAEVRTGVYLNFEENWREDFTIFVAKRDLRRFGGKEHELGQMEGQTIRVRGWLKLRNGPMIDVTHPEQIEIVDG